jgi:hypothetical protein
MCAIYETGDTKLTGNLNVTPGNGCGSFLFFTRYQVVNNEYARARY